MDAGVGVRVVQARAVGDGIPAGEVQDLLGGELGELSAHDDCHGGCERKVGPPLMERGDRADPLRHVAQEVVIVRQTTQQGMKLFQVSGLEHLGQSRRFFRVRAQTRGRNGMAQNAVVPWLLFVYASLR